MKTDTWFGKFYISLEWFVRLALTNILWFVFNLPTLFIGISLLISRSKMEIALFAGLLFLAFGLFVFPATTAMFAVVRILVRKKHVRIIRDFWTYYKENYGKSLLSGFIFAFIWAILFVDYIYFGTQVHVVFKYIFLALFLFMFVFMLNYFAVQVHFYTSFTQGFKNALFITLKNPILSIATVIGYIGIIFLSYKLLPILFVVITIALITTISFTVFYKISLKDVAV